MADAVDAVSDTSDEAGGDPSDEPVDPVAIGGKRARRPAAVLVAALVVGLCTDLTVRQSGPGTAWVLWGSAIVGGMAFAVARGRRAALVVLAGAWLFVPWFALRASPWLLVPNALAYLALVTYAADLAAGGPVRRSVTGFAAVVASWVPAGRDAPALVWHGAVVTLDSSGRRHHVPWRRLGRAALIAVPVLVVLAVLLATGDALFASTFRIESAEWLSHVVWVPLGALVFAVLATMGTEPSRANEPTGKNPLRVMDAGLLLGGVTVLFAAYAGVQLNALLAGSAYVERETGLTYAEYARTGFFQLMAAAAISFGVLCAVRTPVRRAADGGRTLRWLVGAVIVLTQGLVIGSIIRIRLYSNVFGLTHLRLYTVVCAGWLGVVVVLAGVAAIRRGSAGWMAPAAAVLAACAVFAMNLVDPDGLVARRNVGRADVSTARFDGPYLSGLSADAVPWIVAHLDEAPEGERASLLEALCARDFGGDGWASWNLAEARARDALADRCT